MKANENSYKVYRVLENSNAIGIMIWLGSHDGAKKSELYSGVSNSATMPKKLNDMVDAGLLTLNKDGNSSATRVYLTEDGNRVSKILQELEPIFRQGATVIEPEKH